MDECAECRRVFGDLGLLYTEYIPQLKSLPETEDVKIIEESFEQRRLRDSILRAVAREGAQFSDRVSREIEYHQPKLKPAGSTYKLFASKWTVPASFALVSAGVVFGVLAVRNHSQQVQNQASLANSASTAQPAADPASNEAQRRHQEILEQEVAALKLERASLEQDLANAQKRSKEFQNVASGMKGEMDALNVQLDDTRLSQAKAEESLERMKEERQGEQTAIAAQNREIVALNAKLQEKTADREREQDVLAAEQKLRELVGARNLHIVDVYDTEADGSTRPAVGRVFYTEGKSLVFYAYDLSTDQTPHGKYAYFVWGHREGDEQNVRNLGTLDPDDVSQRRWMLKVNDAEALAKIDRVFVTLEPLNKLGSRPRGKRILSAYLGTPPNHP